MYIRSINCSLGETRIWKNQTVQTGIFKTPVTGPVHVTKLNIEGDRQSDLKVHGGPDKAIYAYDLEDYRYWREQLGRELAFGAFGENLTTEGMLDRNVFAGDVLKAGTTILQAAQPRLPCYKLALKFNDDRMIHRFAKAERWGIYFRVLEEGTIEAGDKLEFLERDKQQVPIGELGKIALGKAAAPEIIGRALQISSLSESWRDMLLDR